MKKLIPLFTLVAGLLIAGCSGHNAKALYHQQRGDRFFKAGQFDQAEIEYLHVLRSDAANAHAIGQLGLIYYDEGRLQQAAPYLYKAVELDTNNVDLHAKLGFLYQTVGRVKEARAEAEFILDRCPTNADAPLLLAQTAQMDAQTAGAEKQLQQLAQSHDTAAIEVALGTLALENGHLDEANSALQKARSLDTDSNPEVYAALADLALARHDLKQAQTYFSTASQMAPSRSPFRLQYAQFLLKTGDLNGAKSVLDDMTSRTPDDVPAWIGEAEIALHQKKFDDCAGYLSKALERDDNNYQALLLTAQLDFARGQTDKCIADLKHMADLFPQAPQTQYQLGLAYLASGQTDNAIHCLQQTVNLDTNFTDATVLLAGVQIKTGNPLPAIVLLKHLLQRQPQNSQAALLLAEGDRVQGNTGEALQIYQQLEKSYPTNAQLPLLMGAAFLQDKKFDDAKREFDRALQMDPHQLDAAAQLVDLDLMNRQFDDAKALADRAASENPTNAAPLLLQAKIALAQTDTNGAESILWKAVRLDPSISDPPLLLAQLYYDSNQADKALDLVNGVLGRETNNIAALMFAARIQTRQKDYQAAADSYQKVLAINPQFSPALNNLACLDCDQLGQLDQALNLAQRARQLLPANPSTADTLGWVLSKKGNYSAALNLLQDAAQSLPGEPEIQYHLGKTLYLTGAETPARAAFELALQNGKNFPDRDECKQCLAILAIDPAKAGPADRTALEARISAQPGDPIAVARLAALYKRIGATDQAIATDQAALKINPQNVGALVDLAQLSATTDASRAMDYANTAYKIAPENPQVCAVLGHLAYQSGNFKWALTLLQQADQAKANDPQILFDLANANYAEGNVADAQTTMQTASMLSLPAPEAAEAKRFLAFVSATNAALASAQSAGAGEVLAAQPDYVPALMIKAIVAENNSQAQVAAQTYEKVLDRFPDFAPAQKSLAMLDAKDPATAPRAIALATKALSAFPNDGDLAKVLGVLYFQQGDYGRAENFLATAAAGASPDAEVLYYLGAAQYHLKNREESKTDLQRALSLNLQGQQAADAKRLLAELK